MSREGGACRHGLTPACVPCRVARQQSSVLLVLLFTALIAGRLTLDSWGIYVAKDFELRIPVIAALLLWYFLWLGTAGHDIVRRWPVAMRLVVVHMAVLMLSALWADDRARLVTPLFDLLVVLVFVCIAVNVAALDPPGAATQFIVMLYGTGLVYAVAGLVANSFMANGRLAALGGGPNVFVRVVLLGLLAAVVLAVQRRNFLYLAPAPLLAYAALLSGSRGGLLSATVVALLALLYYARHFKAGYVVTGVALMSAGLYVLARESDDRLARVLGRYSSVERLTDSDRVELFNKAMEIFHRHRLAGAGIDSFAATYAPGHRGAYSHNYLASVLADTGLVGGFALGVGLLAASVAAFRRLRTASPAQAGLLFGALFILAASNFSGDYYDSRLAWVFLAIGLTPAALHRTGAGPPALHRNRIGPPAFHRNGVGPPAGPVRRIHEGREVTPR